MLRAGKAAGLIPRVHANQLGPGPGAQLAAEFGAASADHLTFLDASDIDALAGAGTVATLLPGVEFATRQPYPDAAALMKAGVTVAIATDCNPGSCFTSSMPFCIALAVRELKMTTDQAVWAATAGGARALRRTDVGHLGAGARADVVMLDAPSHAYLAYRPGVPLIAARLAGRPAGGRRPALTSTALDRPGTAGKGRPRPTLGGGSGPWRRPDRRGHDGPDGLAAGRPGPGSPDGRVDFPAGVLHRLRRGRRAPPARAGPSGAGRPGPRARLGHRCYCRWPCCCG